MHPEQIHLQLADVRAHVHDKALAAEAFVTLQQLEEQDLVHVYRPAGWGFSNQRRFNVWDERDQERHTLKEWLARWLEQRQASDQAEGGHA